MTPQQKTKGIILILVAYVVIAVVGFFIVYFIKVTFFPTAKMAPVAAKPVVTSSVPKDWKKYTSPDKAFSFSYPPTMKLKETAHQFGIINVEVRGIDPQKPSVTSDVQMLFMPKTLAMAVGQDFEKYYKAPNNTTTTITSPLSQESTQQNLTKLNNITVDGNRAFRYQSAAKNTANSQTEAGIFIEAGNNLLLISPSQASKSTMDNIVNTLSFKK